MVRRGTPNREGVLKRAGCPVLELNTLRSLGKTVRTNEENGDDSGLRVYTCDRSCATRNGEREDLMSNHRMRPWREQKYFRRWRITRGVSPLEKSIESAGHHKIYLPEHGIYQVWGSLVLRGFFCWIATHDTECSS